MLGKCNHAVLIKRGFSIFILLLVLVLQPRLHASAQDVLEITSISPTTALVGGGPVTITITGQGFLPETLVWWNHNTGPMDAENVTYVSSTQMTAVIPADVFWWAFPVHIAVCNCPDTVSNWVDLIVNNPVPVLTEISPAERFAGDASFTLVMNGSGFDGASRVLWNGEPPQGIELAVTSFSNTQLTASVPRYLVASAGNANISVNNPTPGGGTSQQLTLTISSGINSWISHSPEGGFIKDLAIDPHNPAVLYAATDYAGIYKTVDGGQSWYSVNNGIAQPLVSAIAVDPGDSAHVLATGGTTRNGGGFWASGGLPDAWCAKFNSEHPEYIYACGGTLYVSTDAGSTWNDVVGDQFGSLGSTIRQVVASSEDPNIIFVVADANGLPTADRGLWKTMSGGATWSLLDEATNHIPGYMIYALAIDPNDPNVLYAGTLGRDAPGRGIYKSVDGGDQWALIYPTALNFSTLVVSPADSNYIYAQQVMSNDGGQTWQDISVPYDRIVLDPTDPLTLYSAGYGGVSKSTDRGATWTPMHTGLSAHLISTLAYASDTGTLFTSSYDSVSWSSQDLGTTWLPIDGLNGRRSMLIDPNNQQHMVSAAWGLQTSFSESTDGGQTWVPRTTSNPVQAIAFAANSDLYYGTPGSRIFKSTDGGTIWTEKSSGLEACAGICFAAFIVASPSDPGTVYTAIGDYSEVSQQQTYRFYRTSDGGDLWSLQSVPTVAAWQNGSLYNLAVDPANSSLLFLGTEDGVYRSLDGGQTWNRSGDELAYKQVNVIVLDPFNTQVIYAGTEWDGVYRSLDGGATWTEFNYGMSAWLVRSLVVIPHYAEQPASLPPRPYAGLEQAFRLYTSLLDGWLSAALQGMLRPGTALNSPAQQGIQYVAPSTIVSATGSEVYSYQAVDAPPTDLWLAGNCVPGNMPIGTVIGTFTTTDPDTNEQFGYALVAGEGADDNTAFRISNGILQTAEILDHNVKSAYSVRVRSTDFGGYYVDRTFVVNVSANSAAPVLNVPASATALLNNKPLFDWGNVDGATGYTIQICKNSGCTSVLSAASVVGSNYTPAKPLPAKMTLYWRVRAKLGAVAGPWSVVRSFTTANPPGVPIPAAPANGSLTINYQPKLDWSTVLLPTGTQFGHYEVEVALDSTFASKVDTHTVGNLTTSDYTLSVPLAPNTRYYWHVRSFNSLGEYSAWSAAWSFRTALLPPVLSTPVNDTGSSIHTTAAELEWTNPNLAGVTSYSIQISKYETFAPILKSATTTTTAYTTVLAPNTVYYWRVKANGANGPSDWSTKFAFRTGNPPSIPVLAAPAAGSLTSDYTPMLSWKPSVPAAGTTVDHYEIQVASNSGFTAPTSLNTAALSTDAVTLQPNRIYYWRVRAWNNLGDWSAWSVARALKTALKPPALFMPDNATSGVALRPAFSWTDENAPGVRSYNIQISRSSTFSSILLSASPTATSFVPAVNLPAGTTLYWRVRTTGTNGTSAWSLVFSFTTGAAP